MSDTLFKIGLMSSSSGCAVGWCASGGLCYCFLAKKNSIIAISVLSLLASIADLLFPGPCSCYCGIRDRVAFLRNVLRSFFQAVNLLLIIGSVCDFPYLMQIYILYTLAFIVLGFVVAIIDVLLRVKHEGRWCIINFLTEVAFFFVLFRCLPLVDMYKKQLEGPGGATKL